LTDEEIDNDRIASKKSVASEAKLTAMGKDRRMKIDVDVGQGLRREKV